MLIVRPIRKEDLAAVFDLSSRAKAGLTTLPHDREILDKRIEDSEHSFRRRAKKPGGETYLFVLEDKAAGRVVGICSAISKVGGYEPSYTYEIKTSHKVCKTLSVEKDIQYLQLKREHDGPSEVGTLFLDPEFRRKGAGRLLSLSRFLFIAQYPKCFEEEVIAELRGVLDEEDRSPFWNAVCKHFFVVDFKKADLMVMTDKSFIEELIPQHPIYIPILPKEAQAVLGKVHKDTEPALYLLQSEGFKIIDEIDIFEAGPVVKADVKDIRTVKKSSVVSIIDIVEHIKDPRVHLIANFKDFENFSVTMDSVAVNSSEEAVITKSTAEALSLKTGEQIRIVTIKD